jgi:hypothetical protein
LQEVELFDMFSKNNINADIKNIFFNSLIEKKNFLIYCLIALPLELEKA